MRKIKYKLFSSEFCSDINKDVNEFLDGIDATQVIKIESFDRGTKYCCAITYMNLEDVRDIKLDMLYK